MLKRLSMHLGAWVSLAAAFAGHAATVTYVGTRANLGSGWRTAAVAKPDDDGVLGSTGWFVTGSAIDPNDRLAPPYLTLDTSASEYPGNSSYIYIDDPNTTPVPTPSTIRTGTKNPRPGTNNDATVLSFSTNASVPSTFRLGVMIDNLDGANFNPNGMRVAQQAGPGDSGSLTWSTGTQPRLYDRTPDWLFFDVADAQNGDTFDVIARGGPNGFATAGAFAFDPPPSVPPGGGDVIAIDFSSAGGSAPNYNVINANGTIPAGSVIRLSDGSPVAGVSLTFSGAAGFNNDGNANAWPGTAQDPYYVGAADDITYGGPLTLTVAGLDDLLTYNVRLYSLIGDNPGTLEDFIVTDGAGTVGITNSTRGSRWGSDPLDFGGTVFSGVSTDGAGNIIIQALPVSANAFLNAVTLEAVPLETPAAVIPEPSTVPLAALGLLALAFHSRGRKR